jgi:hypothetical protein
MRGQDGIGLALEAWAAVTSTAMTIGLAFGRASILRAARESGR